MTRTDKPGINYQFSLWLPVIYNRWLLSVITCLSNPMALFYCNYVIISLCVLLPLIAVWCHLKPLLNSAVGLGTATTGHAPGKRLP